MENCVVFDDLHQHVGNELHLNWIHVEMILYVRKLYLFNRFKSFPTILTLKRDFFFFAFSVYWTKRIVGTTAFRYTEMALERIAGDWAYEMYSNNAVKFTLMLQIRLICNILAGDEI